MNRREDPLLRQHRSRLLQLAEITNVKPGHGSGKRRGQRTSRGSNGGTGIRSQITLQDIVRSDPGYTPNIEHLVFPERKSSNPNLAAESSSPSKSKGNITSTRSRLAEAFAKSHSRSTSQESSTAARKNHSTSLDSGGVLSHQYGSGSGLGSVSRGEQRRWLSQNSQSQSSKQYSVDDGVRGGPVGVGGPASTSSSTRNPVAAPRRISPAADSTEVVNPSTRTDRSSNASMIHLRSTSDPWEVGSQGSTYSISSTKSLTGNRGKPNANTRSSSYTRGSSIPSLKRHDTSTSTSSSTGNAKYHRQDSHGKGRRRDAANSFLSGSGGTSGELFVSGNCSRELSPVRWCDREVDGVYLGRSGWVQVQQRSLDENRRASYEANRVTVSAGTLPLPRRVNVKMADYHCSNSEPGKCPNFSHLDNQRPDYLALHGQDYDPPSTCNSPHSIPESFSPPSLTPIISPPPAFQDVGKKSSIRHSRKDNYIKAPFLPRSNAIVDSDIISPPPSPPSQVKWSSLPLSSSRKSANSSSARPRKSVTAPSTSASTPQQQQQQQQYRMAQAKSLEDQSSSRRNQFAQRYIESSSSSSSSMGFRSLDSCMNRTTMPRLTENTDSSVEGYDDGDEDDNLSSLNMGSTSMAMALSSSPESVRANGERISPVGRQNRHHRSQTSLRKSPGSESGKQIFSSSTSSSSSSSTDRQGRSPTPNLLRRNNASRQHQNSRNITASPDTLQSRVRRSRSLQLPEKKSPNTSGPQQISRETNDPHRVVVKVVNDRSGDRNKRYALFNRKAQSTDEALNENILREAEVVTEFLYGSRSRTAARNLLSNRYDRREENVNSRRVAPDVYFISSKQQTQSSKASGVPSVAQQQQQQSRRPRTLQRGVTTPNTTQNSSDFSVSPETKFRCNSNTCDFWPHCSQRDSLYSPNQGPVFMKVSQSYPAHQRMTTDTGSSRMSCGSACSSPVSLERMDDRLESRELPKKIRHREIKNSGKYQDRVPKSALKQSRWSPTTNGSYLKSDYTGFDNCSKSDRKVSPNQNKNAISRSSSGGVISESTSPSSSSSDIWVTTSDRTVTKSPRNMKSSGASTPMEDAVAGSLKTLVEPPKDGILSRPGSAPAKREEPAPVDVSLDPHQRSLSLPKSFLAHETAER